MSTQTALSTEAKYNTCGPFSKKANDSACIDAVSRPSLNGAQAVVLSLLAHGVDTVFGYPGGSIIPVYDALYDSTQLLRHVLVRHEQGAAHAAEGYARASGKPGVCLVTSGPGATNLVTGIADAMLDSVPIVCIAGQVSSSLLGKNSFQEADLLAITKPICKWNYQITDPDEISAVMSKAFSKASSGRPGPVVIIITKDAQTATINDQTTEKKELQFAHPRSLQTVDKLERAAQLINEAKQPLLLAGQGIIISQAEKLLLEFCRNAAIPLATTLMGLSAVPSSDPMHMGMVGMHGNLAPNILSNQADVIIAVGTRFSDRVTGDLSRYARQAKIIHIDIDPSEIGKNVPADVALVGDAREVLAGLHQLVEKTDRKEWFSKFKDYADQEFKEVIKEALYPETQGLRMSETVARLSKMTKGQSLIVSDVGQHQMMAARYYQFEQARSFITSGGLGTMGFALPAAIGASLAAPKKQVVAIIGDGSFQMNMQELSTIVQEGLPLKIILFNNQRLGMVRQWQELFFERRYSFTTVQNPDYTGLAQAFGIASRRVSERTDLDEALQEMLSSNTPFMLEVIVEQEENVFPMIPAGAAVDEIRLS